MSLQNAQRKYDGMMPDDGLEWPEEMDCPECENLVALESGKGTCSKCGESCEFDEDDQ